MLTYPTLVIATLGYLPPTSSLSLTLLPSNIQTMSSSHCPTPLPSVTKLQVDSVTFPPSVISPASSNPLFLGGAGSTTLAFFVFFSFKSMMFIFIFIFLRRCARFGYPRKIRDLHRHRCLPRCCRRPVTFR